MQRPEEGGGTTAASERTPRSSTVRQSLRWCRSWLLRLPRLRRRRSGGRGWRRRRGGGFRRLGFEVDVCSFLLLLLSYCHNEVTQFVIIRREKRTDSSFPAAPASGSPRPSPHSFPLPPLLSSFHKSTLPALRVHPLYRLPSSPVSIASQPPHHRRSVVFFFLSSVHLLALQVFLLVLILLLCALPSTVMMRLLLVMTLSWTFRGKSEREKREGVVGNAGIGRGEQRGVA